MSLWQDFLINDQKIISKCVHYFAIYDRHFSPWRNRALTFFEIGVYRGGSLGMWQRYFGPRAQIVGVDIDPQCRQHEAPGISVRIGDQGDQTFLQSVVDEFGAPDVVLDDGSHQMQHISQSFNFLYPLMPKNGVYMVEDLRCAYWEEFGGGVDKPQTFINRAKGFVDQLNAEHSRGAVNPEPLCRDTFSVAFYDSIVVLEKGDVLRTGVQRTGRYSTLDRAKSSIARALSK